MVPVALALALCQTTFAAVLSERAAERKEHLRMHPEDVTSKERLAKLEKQLIRLSQLNAEAAKRILVKLNDDADAESGEDTRGSARERPKGVSVEPAPPRAVSRAGMPQPSR